MLKIKQLKCKDILHTGLQQANGQPILIFKKYIYIYFFSCFGIVATYEN